MGCMAHPYSCMRHPGTSDPWGLTVLAATMLAGLTWVVSLRTYLNMGFSDPSLVDRMWSIVPWLYVWYWCIASALKPRLLLMASISTVWGVRLTYNFLVKGGFSGGEDYRWAVIRKWYPGWRWELFNLVFICFFQLILLLAFAAPGAAALQSEAPLGPLDVVAGLLYCALVCGESLADRQMFEFQTEKYRRKAAGEPLGPYARGFIDTGLWAYSRHPNYFCEVMMWWVFYLFSVAATGRWLNWTIWGAIFLSGLFLPPGASLDLTESLSLSKYPDYADYQNSVSKFFPWPPQRRACTCKGSNVVSGLAGGNDSDGSELGSTTCDSTE